ncbi:MAG: AbrB family transcriptional regulator [Thermoprotei archaeon]|nr:MAG: AbrB family transcriptional regulator [Thermoprotei archaeon]
MDRQGRILIPSSIRQKLDTSIFLLEYSENEIRLKPIKTISLKEFFDSIEVEVDDFTDTHALRKSLRK